MIPTATHVRTESDFAIEIGFQRGTDALARVFKTMARLIDACQNVDRILAQSIDARIRPVLLLEDVEAGSIRTWLRDQTLDADDAALKKLDWKPIVGKYLVKAKYRAVNFLEGKTTISDRAQIIDLQHELMSEAEQVHVNPIQIHSPISEADVVKIVALLTEPLAELRGSDSAKFITASLLPERASCLEIRLLTKRAWPRGETEKVGLERGLSRGGRWFRLSWNPRERLKFALYWPVRAKSLQQPVNRKRSGLVVETFGSPNTFRTYNLLVNSHRLQSLELRRLRENVTTAQNRWWWRLRRPNVLVGSGEDRKAVG